MATAWKIVSICLVTILIVLMSLWFFSIKKNSAVGRLLTWKVTTNLIKDHLVWGVGSGNFSATLFKYQSRYFAQHPKLVATEGQLADETWYAFNDLLQITAEQGIVGLALFVCLLLNLVRSENVHDSSSSCAEIIASKGMTIAVICAGMFSYPLTLLPFQILFLQNVSVLSSCRGQFNTWPIFLRFPCFEIKNVLPIACCSIMGSFFVSIGINLYSGFREMRFVEEGRIRNRSFGLSTNYPFLLQDSRFVVLYANDLIATGEFNKAIKLLESAKAFCPGKNLFYTLAMAYRYSNKNEKAEEQYVFIENALPGHMRPRYMLAKLYYETGQTAKWRSKAFEVINFKPKIDSNFTKAMVSDIKACTAQGD